MSKTTKLMKNTFIIAIGNICTKCISFFMLPLYTSILSTVEYGNVDLVSTCVSLFTIIITLQFEQGILRFLIEYRDNTIKQKKYITTSLLTIIFINFLFIICLLPILIYIKYEFTIYLILWTIFSSFTSIILQIPRGLGQNTIYAVGSCISGSSQVILNVLFVAILKFGATGMMIASIISLILTIIYISIRVDLLKYLNSNSFDFEIFKILSRYSLPLIPYTLCWWIVSVSDRLIVSFMLGMAANGIYAAANKFPSLFRMITNIFQISWSESASENINDKNSGFFYEKIITRAIKFYSSCSIGIIAIMPFLFDFLLKKDFIQAYTYIPILVIAALFHSIADLYGAIYFAFKETKKVAFTAILSAIINILINLSLIKLIGLYAATISSVIAYIIIAVIQHYNIQKFSVIRISKRYLICELIVYIIVLMIYYMNIKWMQLVCFVIIIPYCILQNKTTLIELINLVKFKFFKNLNRDDS